MVTHSFPPFGSVILVFPFKNLLNFKWRFFTTAAKTHYPKTPAAYVRHAFAFFKMLSFNNFLDDAVKMRGRTERLVIHGRGYIAHGLTTYCAGGYGERIGGRNGRLPFGALLK